MLAGSARMGGRVVETAAGQDLMGVLIKNGNDGTKAAITGRRGFF